MTGFTVKKTTTLKYKLEKVSKKSCLGIWIIFDLIRERINHDGKRDFQIHGSLFIPSESTKEST